MGRIVDQLCNDFAYAVHQPHARNGGLIGLAAAAIALGSVGLVGILSRNLRQLAIAPILQGVSIVQHFFRRLARVSVWKIEQRPGSI